MYNFIVKGQPRSYNSQKLSIYQKRIADAFRVEYPTHEPFTIDVYGLVYHFFRRDIGIDADNLSKPIWDALKALLFEDDKQVKMRIAGSFDLTTNGLTTLDFTGLSEKVINQLLEAINEEEHILYIECGNFTVNMIRLNLERNGN